MFSYATALGSESSRPVGVAFCILGFSVTVQVDHRALAGTHECCFVREGGTSSLPQEGGRGRVPWDGGGGGRVGSTKDLVRFWSSLIFAKEMYWAYPVMLYKVFKYIVCGHDCVCLMRCKVNPRQNCVSHMRPRQCLAGPKYHFQSRHTNLHMPHYGAHEIVFKAFYNALYTAALLSIGTSPPPPTKSCKAEKVWLLLQTALTDFITLLNWGLSKYWVWPGIWETQVWQCKMFKHYLI